MRAVRAAKMQKVFDALWAHQMGLLTQREIKRIVGIQDVEMGTVPPKNWMMLDDVLVRHCHFEEMERDSVQSQ